MIRVPGSAVVMLRVWHCTQDIWSKSTLPAWTAELIGPRGGTLVARMNCANASTSSPSSSGSATASKAATERPFELFSTANALNPFTRFVMPISLR